MTPVPTIVMLRISLLFAITSSLLNRIVPNFSHSLGRSCSPERSLDRASFLVGSAMVYDQTRSPLTRDKGPYPLEEHAHAQTGGCQELQMHGRPCKPS